MNKKRILCVVLSVLLLVITPLNTMAIGVNNRNIEDYLEKKYGSNSIIFIKNDKGQVREVLMTDLDEIVPMELLNKTKEIGIPIHKEIPANLVNTPLINTLSTWTHTWDMDTTTNKYFQVLTSAAIAAFLSTFCGGKTVTYTTLAAAIVSAYYTTENVNVYFLIQYYWKPSNDPVFSYYVRQDTHAYKNSARTDYIDTSARYYYSSMPF